MKKETDCHRGIVERVADGEMTVAVGNGGGSCDGCSLGRVCGLSGVTRFSLKNEGGFKAGDRVRLTPSEVSRYVAALLLGGIPVLLLVATAGAASLAGLDEDHTALACVVAGGFYFVMLRLFGRRADRSVRWRVEKICD